MQMCLHRYSYNVYKDIYGYIQWLRTDVAYICAEQVVQFLGENWMGFQPELVRPANEAAKLKNSNHIMTAKGGVGQKKQEAVDTQELLAQRENIYLEPILPWGMRHPNSKFSMMWDILQIIFLLRYVLPNLR